MTKVRAQVNAETSKNQLPWGHTNLIGTVYLNPVTGGNAAETTPVAAAEPASEVELEFWRSIKDSNKTGGTQCLPHQLSERHLQADRAGADRFAAGRPFNHHPAPDHGRRR